MTGTIVASTTGTARAPISAVWELLDEWRDREDMPTGARWSEWTRGSCATIELDGVRAIPVRSCGFTISTVECPHGTELEIRSTAQPTLLGRLGRRPLQRFGDYLVRNILRALIRDIENGTTNDSAVA